MTPVPTKYPVSDVVPASSRVVQEAATILNTTVENIVESCLQDPKFVDTYADRAYPHPARGEELSTDWIQSRLRFRMAVRVLVDTERRRRRRVGEEGAS